MTIEREKRGEERPKRREEEEGEREREQRFHGKLELHEAQMPAYENLPQGYAVRRRRTLKLKDRI